MQCENYFFLLFFLTVATVRMALYLKPIPSPTIKGFRAHHYMFGAVLVPIAFTFGSVELYAVGLGLVVDELTFLITGGRNHQDNYSLTSNLGTALLVILVFFLRDDLAALLF